MDLIVEMPANKVGVLSEGRVTHNGLSRLFLYYVPTSYKQGDALPLMLTLHGRAFNAKQQLSDCKFVELSERKGFIVIAPNCVTIDNDNNLASEGLTFMDLQGVDPNNIRWNVDYPLHNSLGIDDVGYLSALIDYIADEFKADTRRVYVAGMSNGAVMSMRLATQLTHKFAGAAAICGIVPNVYMNENLNAPIKILFINGDKDPIVSLDGYEGFAPPLLDAAKWFSKQFGASEEAVVTTLPQSAEGDPTKVVEHRWEENGGGQVTMYIVEDGGHTWPSGTQYFAEERIGKICRHIDSSLIWDELKGFKR